MKILRGKYSLYVLTHYGVIMEIHKIPPVRKQITVVMKPIQNLTKSV